MAGDKLASGAKSASFTSNDGTVTQEKWDDMFKDFDPEQYRAKAAKEPEFVEPPPLPQEATDAINQMNERAQEIEITSR